MVEIAPPLDHMTVLENQSYQEFLKAAETFTHLRIEYISGDIVMAPAPIPAHQLTSANLMFELQSWVRQQSLGIVLAAPLDVELEAGVAVVQPDLIFVRQARVPSIIGKTRLQGVPDLIVEILSPSTARIDRAMKLQLYARYGVPEYWIVNPEDTTVEVYTHHAQSYLVAGIYGPGETVAAGLFAPAKINVDSILPADPQSTGPQSTQQPN